ncbi:FMN-binding negative transcriptional regulator [Chitinimonas koreensis]|uniref:FMN-binding negative transcriptional regulator n=1 Tax=Chitinimonas koreensis TaxID=356302 RepID=UPI00041F12C1|nr:FMN-binding negative transcriptional regulator [Chitinimonas koreensis]QNM96022.1 FMN-binding negative transcriptional regulator [Chitinimonas koreensis]
MYLPASFTETRPALLHALIDAHPLASVLRAGPDGIEADPLPLQFDAGGGEHGRLLGHVAAGNPLAAAEGQAVTVLFHGPDGYVSPGWYPGKARDGRAVPTWNYALVQVRGRLRCRREAAWLQALLARLSERFEAGRPAPWSIDDAPAAYIEKMLGAIVGIEIEVDQMVGKFKLSQNRSAEDQAGVRAGLAADGEDALLHWMLRVGEGAAD